VRGNRNDVRFAPTPDLGVEFYGIAFVRGYGHAVGHGPTPEPFGVTARYVFDMVPADEQECVCHWCLHKRV